jgi:hypothetical protein
VTSPAATDLERAVRAVEENPENLTDRQQAKLSRIQKTNARLYRAYLLKEQLRQIYVLPSQAGDRAARRVERVGQAMSSRIVRHDYRRARWHHRRDQMEEDLAIAGTVAAASACGGESVAGVGDDELALELGEHREYPEHGTTFGRACIDALFDDVQADAALAQLGAEGHEVQDRPAQAVQPRDVQRVAVAQQAQHVVEFRTAPLAWSM